MQSKQLSAVVLLTLLIIKSTVTAAAPAVKIYSLEESGDTKLSQPRIYIENLSSSVPISNFYYYYYFTVENGKTPAPPEDYYTPNSIPTLESLGNGNYRIKYTFLGVTIQPGEILPNTSGNVIGIHYTDWSEMDKTNDHSNNLSSTFALNTNIPAFLADGTPINGNPPPDPGNPPQPPPVSGSIGDFAVFSEECTDLRDRVKIIAGNVGSLIYTELGCDDTLYGDVLSVGSIFLRENARIYGNVTSSQSITEQNGVYVEDIKRSFAQLELPELQTPVVTYGTVSISISPNDSYTLWPGMYDSFHAYANAKITIQPGDYSFREFILEPNDTLLLNVSHGDRINFNIKDHCSLGNGTIMKFPDGIDRPYALNMHSAQTTQLYIGTESEIKGLVYAPDAEVHVYSRTEIKGSLYGKRVVVEPEVLLCKPPTLISLFHSEGAMAPPFDPLAFDYIAVVPDVTTTIVVLPEVRTEETVTVNGHAPTDTVTLTETENKIAILLNHPEACGTTEYNLTVTRSEAYRIFVDPESVCTPGKENGQSWTTAYKNLQTAIDSAAKTGKELWLREGVYIPSIPTNPGDLRTATFLIPSGIELKGGFIGTEMDDDPLGSLYNTILTGDVNGDDTNFTSWPPSDADTQYVDDNLYHVITVAGNPGSKDIHVSNIIVTHGYADGDGIDASGAGILVKSGNPDFDLVGIIDNYANSHGAGMYVGENGGLDTLKNILFQGAEISSGSGAGLHYRGSTSLVVDASVFDNNTTKDSSGTEGGSAVYFKDNNAKFINSVFSENNSNSINGTVMNDGGTLFVQNCTFAFNTSNDAASISNSNSANTEVMNSILWNNSGMDEVNGDNITINHSCITSTIGYSGSHNKTSNPLFQNSSKPAGNNGKWGDFDDGLRLTYLSPCINLSSANIPDVDFLTLPRADDYEEWAEAGAYEYLEYSENTDISFGYILPSGLFFQDEPIEVMDTIWHWWYISIYAKSNIAYTVRAYVPKNKYTNGKIHIYSWLYSLNDDGSVRTDIPPVKIDLYKVDDISGKFIFQTETAGGLGKPMIFVSETSYHNWNNNWAYVVSTENGYFKSVTPSSQF